MHAVWAAVVVVSAAAAVVGQERPSASVSRETAHLKIATSAVRQAAGPERKVTLVVDVAPKPKMHVYSPGQAGYLAIALTLDADPAFTAAKPKYPAGEKLYMPLLKETQLVYSKPFRISQDVTLRPREDASPEVPPLTIKGTLRYQACDDKVCYLPHTLAIEWTLDR